jgi:hypothetical protein
LLGPETVSGGFDDGAPVAVGCAVGFGRGFGLGAIAGVPGAGGTLNERGSGIADALGAGSGAPGRGRDGFHARVVWQSAHAVSERS